MVYIKNIGKYIPENYLDNLSEAEFNGKDLNWLTNSIGIINTPKKSSKETVLSMCINAYNDLKKNTDILQDSVDLIVLVSQNTDYNSLPQQSTQLQHLLGFNNNLATFDISLGCSGYVYALNVIESMMVNNSFKSALLFTCDPYSKIINESDYSNKILFGDAATATYLTLKNNDEKLYSTKKYKLFSHGQYTEYLVKKESGLFMDGRRIFNFVKNTVFDELNDFISKVGKDIDLIIPHQASNLTLQQFKKQFENRIEVATQIQNHGNTVSSSIPLVLSHYLNQDKYDRIIMAGFGVGMSSAYVLIEKEL